MCRSFSVSFVNDKFRVSMCGRFKDTEVFGFTLLKSEYLGKDLISKENIVASFEQSSH